MERDAFGLDECFEAPEVFAVQKLVKVAGKFVIRRGGAKTIEHFRNHLGDGLPVCPGCFFLKPDRHLGEKPRRSRGIVRQKQKAERLCAIAGIHCPGFKFPDKLAGGIAVFLGNARKIFGLNEQIAGVRLDDYIGLGAVVVVGPEIEFNTVKLTGLDIETGQAEKLAEVGWAVTVFEEREHVGREDILPVADG